MDIPRLFAMDKYWRSHPPLREMVQAYLGIKSDDYGIKDKPEASGNMDDLLQMFGGIGGSLG